MTPISHINELVLGQAIPELVHTITTADLVRYAGASDDYAPQHWDHLYMSERGFPGVIVHGWFTFALMCRAATDWISPETADVASYAVRYHTVTLPGEIHLGGEVIALMIDGDERTADLKLWAKNTTGVMTTSGTLSLKFA
ncbi:MAG: MaoC/PaaZ C-terminal domain-containing protein [Phenylobacterium sp.]|uniref:MaoC/PaaZ C-terminal domain-containing protein n=1 Tax=Phenylobacterium sp. TaxID=1871053 RepID=UPI002732CBC2|nr:MaoC/PaaZ C-terminal domain-containing protein [Phenylobacterium sp.]MDP3175865.1 MaoC/PaaZ C-terminal domain-containing protein [Phenylobacterium sp.]